MDQNVTQSKVLTISTEQLRLSLYNQGFLQRVRSIELPQIQLWCWLKLSVHIFPLGSSISAHWNRIAARCAKLGGPPGLMHQSHWTHTHQHELLGRKSPWIISFLSVTTLWWEAFKLFLRHSWRIDLYLMSGIIVGFWVSKQRTPTQKCKYTVAVGPGDSPFLCPCACCLA